MYVVKRTGERQEVHFDKITSRIKKLCYGLNADYVDPVRGRRAALIGARGFDCEFRALTALPPPPPPPPPCPTPAGPHLAEGGARRVPGRDDRGAG